MSICVADKLNMLCMKLPKIKRKIDVSILMMKPKAIHVLGSF